ncbi:MAG: helix-turn-helix domain-containing protein [Dehalococcoidia bacterium]
MVPKPQAVRDPLGATLDIVGDRWTLLVVRDLLRGRCRFNELRESVVGIASNLLADRLRRLEDAGVVQRRWYSDAPPRAEYVLTPKGHGLGIAVGALLLWGERYTQHDLTLIDGVCGHNVELVYRCPLCDRDTPRSQLRIVEM